MSRIVLISIFFSTQAFAIKPGICGPFLPSSEDKIDFARFNKVTGPRDTFFRSPTQRVLAQMQDYKGVRTEFEVTAEPGKILEVMPFMTANFGDIKMVRNASAVVVGIRSDELNKFLQIISNDQIPIAKVTTSALAASADRDRVLKSIQSLILTGKISGEDSLEFLSLLAGNIKEAVLEITPQNAQVDKLGIELTAAGLPLDALNATIMLYERPKRVERFFAGVTSETVGMVVEGLKVPKVKSARFKIPE